MNAVDTNVFIYALDDNEPVKQAQARELLDHLVSDSSATQLLWQVAGEILSCLRKWEAAKRISRDDVEAHFKDVLAMFPLCAPSTNVFRLYFELRSRFSLSHWDSMLLAACQEAGATTLYSEDMGAGTNYGGVSVVNPFA